MIDICPTITAGDARTYEIQIRQVIDFAMRLHIDVANGSMTPNTLLPLDEIWWPAGLRTDIHVMYKRPFEYLQLLIELQPQLVIVHAEAEGDFIALAEKLHGHGIEVGVALLPETSVDIIKPAIEHIDHVLIFSGNIGHFGGHADLNLLRKAKQVKEMRSQIEIGWDGGINDHNAKTLVEGGVEVLNAGGFLHGAAEPFAAFDKLKQIVSGEPAHA